MTEENRAKIEEKVLFLQAELIKKGSSNDNVDWDRLVERRHLIGSDRRLLEVLKIFWFVFVSQYGDDDSDTKTLSKEGFIIFNTAVQYALYPNRNRNDLLINAEIDWLTDQQMYGDINETAFYDILFEVIDNDVLFSNALYYASFSWTLLNSIADLNEIPPKIKPFRKISWMKNETEATMYESFLNQKELRRKINLAEKEYISLSCNTSRRLASRKKGRKTVNGNEERILDLLGAKWFKDTKHKESSSSDDSDSGSDNDNSIGEKKRDAPPDFNDDSSVGTIDDSKLAITENRKALTFDEKWALKIQLRKDFEQKHKRDVKRSFIIGGTLGEKYVSRINTQDASYDDEFLEKQRRLLNFLFGSSNEDSSGKLHAAIFVDRGTGSVVRHAFSAVEEVERASLPDEYQTPHSRVFDERGKSGNRSRFGVANLKEQKKIGSAFATFHSARFANSVPIADDIDFTSSTQMSDDDNDELLHVEGKYNKDILNHVEKYQSKDSTRRQKGGRRSLHDAKGLDSPFFTVHKLLSPTSIGVLAPLIHVKCQENTDSNLYGEVNKVVFDIYSPSADGFSRSKIIGTPSKEVSVERLLLTESTSSLHSPSYASSDDNDTSIIKSQSIRRKTPLNVKNSLRTRKTKETSLVCVEFDREKKIQPLIYEEALQYYLQKNLKYSSGSVSHEDGSALTTFKGGVQPRKESEKGIDHFSHNIYGNISMATLASRNIPPINSIPAWNHLRALQKSRQGIRNLNTFPYVERSRMKKGLLRSKSNAVANKKSLLKPLFISKQHFSTLKSASTSRRHEDDTDDDVTLNTAKTEDSNYMDIDRYNKSQESFFPGEVSNEENSHCCSEFLNPTNDVANFGVSSDGRILKQLDCNGYVASEVQSSQTKSHVEDSFHGSIYSDISFLDDLNEDKNNQSYVINNPENNNSQSDIDLLNGKCVALSITSIKAVKQILISEDNTIYNTSDKRLIFEKELSFDNYNDDSISFYARNKLTSLEHLRNSSLKAEDFKLKGFKVLGRNTIPLDVLKKAKLENTRLEGKVTQKVVLQDVNSVKYSRLLGGAVSDKSSVDTGVISGNRFSDLDSLPSISIMSTSSHVSTSSPITPPWLPHNALKHVQLTKSIRFNNQIEKITMLKNLKVSPDPTNVIMTIKRQDALRHRFEGFINAYK